MCRGDLKYHGSTTAMLHHLRAKHQAAWARGYAPKPVSSATRGRGWEDTMGRSGK